MNISMMENTQPIRHIKKLCVFCGSSTGSRPVYADAAVQLGGELAKSGVALIFGGGRVGLMGVLANATLKAGGQTAGDSAKLTVR